MIPGLLTVLATAALAGTTGCSGTDGAKRPSAATAATGPVVPSAAAPSPSPSASARPSRSGARPASPTPRPSATPGARVTEATLSLNPTGVGPFCRSGSVDVRYSWSVKVDSPASTPVQIELHTSDGLAATDKRTAEKGSASGSGRYALPWEDGDGRRIVDFWVTTTAPSRAESRHVSFTLRCGPA
jgi:pyruvate/2-oxoglutarate dehydrogenase complex dihydrolipoamide acyltransferase (E2) component